MLLSLLYVILSGIARLQISPTVLPIRTVIVLTMTPSIATLLSYSKSVIFYHTGFHLARKKCPEARLKRKNSKKFGKWVYITEKLSDSFA